MTRQTSGVTLQQLYYFIEVAAEGSITAAADILYVAQPTMSAAMKDWSCCRVMPPDRRAIGKGYRNA